MKIKEAALLALLLVSSAANSAQFESIINAMAIETSDGSTNVDWESTSKIKGVKWKWPYYESGAHDSTMFGTTKVGKSKNPNIGATEVIVKGSRTMLSSISISIANESIDFKEFGKAKVTQIKTSCDEDSSSSYTVAFYKFEKPGYKPLYISQISSWGAGGSGSIDFEITYMLEDALGAASEPCEVLQ